MIVFYLLFMLLLLSPKTTHIGIKNGLILLENQVVPSLYPFILLSSYIRIKSINTSISSPFMLLIGILSGYPVGAKIISELSPPKVPLSRQKLLLLCNLPSPAYMISFVGLQCFGQPQLGLLIYLCMIIGNTFTVILQHLLSHSKTRSKKTFKKIFVCEYTPAKIHKTKDSFQSNLKFSPSFNTVIHDSFITLGNIVAYILIFNIAAAFIQTAQQIPSTLKPFVIGLLEITTGLSNLTLCHYSLRAKLVAATGMISFGGLSVIAQTASIIHSNDISIKKYMTDKAIASIIAMSVMYGITLLFK